MAKLDSMKKLVALGFAFLSILVAPAIASADEVAGESPGVSDDTINLRNGGLIRGRITEIVTGDHVSLTLPSGASLRIPWSDVQRVVVASTSASIPPPAPPPLPAPQPPRPPMIPDPDHEPMVGPMVRVHIESSGTAYLYRQAAGTTDFVTACESPCDADMPLNDRYKLGGTGFTTTEAFMLKGSPGGKVRLRISGTNWWGVVGGGALVFAGLVIPAAGSDDNHSSRHSSPIAPIVGLGAIGLGVLVIYMSMTTDFSQRPVTPKDHTAVRKPVWRTASATEQSTAPTTFPILWEKRF